MVTSLDMQQITERAKAISKEEWKKVRFDQIADLISERVDNPSEAGALYYVGLEHLDSESLKIKRWGIPSDVEATKLRFKAGDIIFGKRRAYQRKLAVAEFDGICSAHAFVLRAKEAIILKDFLPFLMQSDVFFEKALAISVGSLSPTINWKMLAQQEFMLPPKDEQQRIADILWAADEAFEKYQKALEMIKINKQFQLESAYVSSYITFAELGSYTNLITSGSRGWTKYFAPEGCIFLRITNLSRKTTEINMKDLEFLSLPQEVEGRRTQVREGDLLISITADLGRVAIVPSNFPESYVNQHIALVRLNLKMVNPYFVAYYLLSSEGQKQFQRFNDAGAKAGLNLQSIRNLQIPYLPLSEQNSIVHSLRTFDTYIFEIEEHLKKQMSLRNFLLHLTELDLNAQFIK